MATSLERLRQALEIHRQALEELETALLEFEDALREGMPEARGGRSFELLSIAEVCKTLGMGKSWTYRRIRSGEIPSVKLGRSIKVKRSDLEEYLEKRRYQPTSEE